MDRVKRSWPPVYVKINAILQGLARFRMERGGLYEPGDETGVFKLRREIGNLRGLPRTPLLALSSS